MKTRMILLFLTLFILKPVCSQSWSTRQGRIDFEASVAGFEAVEARSEEVAVLLHTADNKLAVLARVSAFVFPNALMQKHFNENYMDSDEFPRMTFSGSWEDKMRSGRHVLSGTLTIRGVSRELDVPVEVNRSPEFIRLSGAFTVRPEDYGVEVPRVVRMKVAEDVRIRFDFTLEPDR